MTWEQLDAQLLQLWDCCSSTRASEADWRALYGVVSKVLLNCNAPELTRLPDDRRAYVDGFFAQKVFLAMKPGSRPYHCGALVVFFRRYLRDEMDRQAKLVELPDELADGSGELTGNAGGEATRTDTPNIEQTLREECNKTVEQVAASAVQFIAGLRQNETWAWLMLRYSFFASADDRVPLQMLAERHQIPSWHYRARRLGINHKGGGKVEQFRGTLLGDWLETALGKAVSPEMHDSVAAAFEILGAVALKD